MQPGKKTSMAPASVRRPRLQCWVAFSANCRRSAPVVNDPSKLHRNHRHESASHSSLPRRTARSRYPGIILNAEEDRKPSLPSAFRHVKLIFRTSQCTRGQCVTTGSPTGKHNKLNKVISMKGIKSIHFQGLFSLQFRNVVHSQPPLKRGRRKVLVRRGFVACDSSHSHLLFHGDNILRESVHGSLCSALFVV
jgi:hypothetical protein